MNQSLKLKGKRLACVGEVMIELIAGPDSTAKIGVAGDTYNTAAYLSRFLRQDGWTVSYVTELGEDPFSDRVAQHMHSHGIDSSHVRLRPDKNVGLYSIETDAFGERRFSYWRSDSAARNLFSEDAGNPKAIARILDGFDVVFLSGISLAILPEFVRSALILSMSILRDQGCLVAFDSNYRPRLWDDAQTARRTIETMWQSCDIALPSADDEKELFGDADESAILGRHQSYGYGLGVLKRGPRGPTAIVPGVEAIDWSPAQLVVDTTAAGDSFNAAFLASHLLGHDILAAMRAGHETASRVVAQRGAIVDT